MARRMGPAAPILRPFLICWPWVASGAKKAAALIPMARTCAQASVASRLHTCRAACRRRYACHRKRRFSPIGSLRICTSMSRQCTPPVANEKNASRALLRPLRVMVRGCDACFLARGTGFPQSGHHGAGSFLCEYLSLVVCPVNVLRGSCGLPVPQHCHEFGLRPAIGGQTRREGMP